MEIVAMSYLLTTFFKKGNSDNESLITDHQLKTVDITIIPVTLLIIK